MINPGDTILVSDNGVNYLEREHVGYLKDKYLCKVPDEPTLYAWNFAKELDDWTEHDGKSWPACELTDKVIVKYKNGEISEEAFPAGDYTWSFYSYGAPKEYDIIGWRLK